MEAISRACVVRFLLFMVLGVSLIGGANGAPVYKITAPGSGLVLGKDQSTKVKFNVEGKSGLNLTSTFEFNYLVFPNYVTLEKDVSSSCVDGMVLNDGESCDLVGTVTAGGSDGTDRIGPRVCAFSGELCSGLTQPFFVQVKDEVNPEPLLAGRPVCWGNNNQGKFGAGLWPDVTESSTPIEMLNADGATSVAMGYALNCVVVDGGVKCSGYDAFGKLGRGTDEEDTNLPVDVLNSDWSRLTGAARVAAGYMHNCAVVGDGAKCWGWNGYAQLGIGDTENKNLAVSVLASENVPLTGVTDISAGLLHTCAVVAGKAKCWGSNSQGELGDGDSDALPKFFPVDVLIAESTPLTGVTSIGVGMNFSCALTGSKILCWGQNNFGQLGSGDNDNRNMAVYVIDSDTQEPLTGATALSVGMYDSCAIVANSEVKCWGINFRGELGDGSTDPRNMAVTVLTSVEGPPLVGVTAIAVGYIRSCAVIDGQIKCWGDNSYGQLGIGKTEQEQEKSLFPVDVVGVGGEGLLTDVLSIGQGFFPGTQCAIVKITE